MEVIMKIFKLSLIIVIISIGIISNILASDTNQNSSFLDLMNNMDDLDLTVTKEKAKPKAKPKTVVKTKYKTKIVYRKPKRHLLFNTSFGNLVPVSSNVKDSLETGYGGSIQLKLTPVTTFMGIRYQVGFESGYYSSPYKEDVLDTTELKSYFVNYIVDADLNIKEVNLGAEFGIGYFYQTLAESEKIKTAIDEDRYALSYKYGARIGYIFNKKVGITFKFSRIIVVEDFCTWTEREFNSVNMMWSFII